MRRVFGKVLAARLPGGGRPGPWLWVEYTGDPRASVDLALFARRGEDTPTGWREAFHEKGRVGIRVPQNVSSGTWRVRARQRGGPVVDCGFVTLL